MAGTQPFDGDQCERDAQLDRVAVGDQQDVGGVGQAPHEARITIADLANTQLLLLADGLDDIERARIAAENRLRSLVMVKGLATTDMALEVASIVDGLLTLEKSATKALEKAMKAHPLGPWVMRTKGVGLKQAARLLAVIGDPLWNGAEDRPRRGPAELWQFCGHGDPKRSRLRKGEKVEFSPQAKMRVHLVAVSCMKQRSSPYRAVYDKARAHWAVTRPDATDGHAHNHALRLVGKAVLKDLFVEARALDQGRNDTHCGTVEGS